MRAKSNSIWRAAGVIAATLLGVVFFNTLIGVFGLSQAIVGLLLFVALAVFIFKRAQTEGTPR